MKFDVTKLSYNELSKLFASIDGVKMMRAGKNVILEVEETLGQAALPVETMTFN